jgi:hypothetical protein
MLSGVSAKVAVKVFGPDLEQLRTAGRQIAEIARTIPGFTDVNLEAQVPIPQLKIEVDRERARAYGVRPGLLNEQLSALLAGKVLAELRDGQRAIDLLVRLPHEWRDTPRKIAAMPIETQDGQRVPLRLVANVLEAQGPNVINRENTQRRIVIGMNTGERDLESLVTRLDREIRGKMNLPEGLPAQHRGRISGPARGRATHRAALRARLCRHRLSPLRLFPHPRLCHPGALRHSPGAHRRTPFHLVQAGEYQHRHSRRIHSQSREWLRAIPSCSSPITCTSCSTRVKAFRGRWSSAAPWSGSSRAHDGVIAGIALVPLVLAAGEPGKEILHPVAVVIVGGLITSTVLGLGVTPAVFYTFGRPCGRNRSSAGCSGRAVSPQRTPSNP